MRFRLFQNFGAVFCLLVGMFTVASVSIVYAEPYSGEETFTYTQPDRASFLVKLYGDEYFAYQRTLDGQEVVRDPQSGFYCYARLSADGRSFISTGVPVVTRTSTLAQNKSKAQSAGVAKANQTLPTDVVLARVRAAQLKFRVDSKGRPIRSSAAKQAQPAPGDVVPGPPSRTTTGDFTGLCILVDFPDEPGTIAPAEIDNLLNQPSGYTGFSNACSVNEYFSIQSNGRMNFCNTVTAYVRMPNPKTYYDDGQPIGSKALQLVSTALDILVEDGFDFTQLSRDASGYIYSINIFYAGTCASGWSEGLWPHSWGLGSEEVDPVNHIYADRYQMSDLTSSPDIGTFCHENGHLTCDFPDLYSYATGTPSIVGYFSLMSQGSHGGGGRHPNSVDPYLKIKAGWADVVDVNSSSHLRTLALEDRNYFLRFKNPARSEEYFLVDNRNDTGYEGPYGGHTTAVAPSKGLAVWHVLETGSNVSSTIQTSGTYGTPYEAFVVEATPTTLFTPWYSDPDPFPGSLDTFHSTRGANPLSDTSSPELKFWSATGRTTNSGMVLHTYDAAGPAVAYTVGSGSPSATPAIGLTVAQIQANATYGVNPADRQFRVYNAAGGTLSYNITDDAAWLVCSPVSGSITTESNAITVPIDSSALASGTHTATITVTSAGASNTPMTIPVTLIVENQSVLNVAPLSITDQLWPGQTSSDQSFTISNAGGGIMGYTVSSSAGWITPSVSSGSCQNETDTVYLTLDPSGLPAGISNGTVTITAGAATGSPATVNVQLTVNSGVVLNSPNGGEKWLRGVSRAIEWESNAATNMRIELLKGGALDRTIVANTADDGSYDWLVPADIQVGSDYRIRITTVDDAYADQSDADFSIIQAIYGADMTADPGWTLSGQWAYGMPTGGGGTYGGPDPTSGYTGANVIGYNLTGGYLGMATSEWATTPAIDCSLYSNVTLEFARWLGVEKNYYDHASIDVSNDNGSTWHTVWTNGTLDIDDAGWEIVNVNLSPYADQHSSVKVRWGMGPTDSSYHFCGWNIDDVLVTGDYSPLGLTSPNGGEQWKVDTTQPIQWASALPTHVRIELLKGGSLDRVLIADTENDGSYDWLIPSDLAPGNDYRIRITTVDEANSDESNGDFTLYDAIYEADMSVDPGWTLSGQWAYGTPTGGSGSFGGPDPTAGYTGANVIGYNLTGGYADNMAATAWATTPAFDCSGNETVTLSFYRWLGVEDPLYDHAYVQVSNDGSNWTTVWENNVVNYLYDGNWQYCEYDLSSVAANQPSVRVRWGMGPTDFVVNLCGWNIDDVMVTGASAQQFYTVTFQTDGTTDASLTGDLSQTVAAGSDCTPVTANAPVGMELLGWAMDLEFYSTDNPVTVTNVTKDCTMTAVFWPAYFDLSYSAGPGGTVTGTLLQSVIYGGNGSSVTAVPDPGYHFVRWSDGVMTAQRTDSAVTQDITVSAEFAINTSVGPNWEDYQ